MCENSTASDPTAGSCSGSDKTPVVKSKSNNRPPEVTTLLYPAKKSASGLPEMGEALMVPVRGVSVSNTDERATPSEVTLYTPMPVVS